MKATIYITYQLTVHPNNLSNYLGFKDNAHCNYIAEVEVDTNALAEINLFFDYGNDFQFLNTGYTATNIFCLVQKVLDGDELKSDGWKKYDLTSQIVGHVTGQPLTSTELLGTISNRKIFKINLTDYDNILIFPTYTLSYLSYPSSGTTDLVFGDEEYFIGNVETEIQAKIYPMNITIDTNAFTFSNNATWTENNDVYVSEVGIYDDLDNLIGIGKLQSPIKSKNNVIVFGLDF